MATEGLARLKSKRVSEEGLLIQSSSTARAWKKVLHKHVSVAQFRRPGSSRQQCPKTVSVYYWEQLELNPTLYTSDTFLFYHLLLPKNYLK